MLHLLDYKTQYLCRNVSRSVKFLPFTSMRLHFLKKTASTYSNQRVVTTWLWIYNSCHKLALKPDKLFLSGIDEGP